MSAWTSEPWTIFPVDPNTVLRCTGGGNKVLAELEGCTMPDSLGGTPAANAARIVAAVNAVAGIPTEDLVRLGLGGLAKIYADSRQQNV